MRGMLGDVFAGEEDRSLIDTANAKVFRPIEPDAAASQEWQTQHQ